MGTSQDVSFDSKDSSSPSDTDRTPQMMRAAADLTLAIHPMRTPPTPQNIPIHPLSRRYQAEHSAPQAAPQCPPQPQQLQLQPPTTFSNLLLLKSSQSGRQQRD